MRESPSIVIRNIEEARILADYIEGKRDLSTFDDHFANKYSSNFDPAQHLDRVGVINQTTMLASETHENCRIL